MSGHKEKSCIFLIFLQLFSWQSKIALAQSAVMSSNDQDQNENQISSNVEPPYTITERDGRLNVVFTSGDMKGQNFQIDPSKIPPPIDYGQPQQLVEEPPYPYSFLDGDGNEISQEEFERLSALEIAEEARLEQEGRAAETEREN
jgi:hypothetical protein